jgi:hypothetical protein
MVKFATTPYDAVLINRIAKRAWDLEWVREGYASLTDLKMDLTATHLNGSPLRLRALLEADNFTLVSDIDGIRRHLDRKTGKLTGLFTPRFSRPSEEAR